MYRDQAQFNVYMSHKNEPVFLVGSDSMEDARALAREYAKTGCDRLLRVFEVEGLGPYGHPIECFRLCLSVLGGKVKESQDYGIPPGHW